MYSRGDRINAVRHEICAEVQCEHEEEGFRDKERVRSRDCRSQRAKEARPEGCVRGSLFYDGPVHAVRGFDPQSYNSYRSMVQTSGATRNPAAAADAASAPARRPRLCVFHLENLSGSNVFLTAGRPRDSGTAIKDDARAGFSAAASLLPRVSSCIGIEEESTLAASRSFFRSAQIW